MVPYPRMQDGLGKIRDGRCRCRLTDQVAARLVSPLPVKKGSAWILGVKIAHDGGGLRNRSSERGFRVAPRRVRPKSSKTGKRGKRQGGCQKAMGFDR